MFLRLPGDGYSLPCSKKQPLRHRYPFLTTLVFIRQSRKSLMGLFKKKVHLKGGGGLFRKNTRMDLGHTVFDDNLIDKSLK
jgi:hypothetical protein